MPRHKYIISLIFSSVLTCFIACKKPLTKKDNTLKIAVSSDANSLNPLKARGELSNYICLQIFQSLLAIDYYSNSIQGQLAEARPMIEKKNDKTIYHYRIRPNAQFDSLHPITADDILFSFKLAICPGIAHPGAASFYSFIDSIIIDQNNNKKVSFVCNKNYFLNEFATGDFFILPSFIYDPNNVLKEFSISDLRNEFATNNPKLNSFVEEFQQLKFEKEPDFIQGSGPYEIIDWRPNRSISLRKKETWWAASNPEGFSFFDQNPDEIKYLVISNEASSMAALQSKEIDLIKGVSPKGFQNLSKDPLIRTLSIEKMGIDYLGFNCMNKYLEQKEFRKAIAHLIPKQEIQEKIFYNLVELCNSPIPAIQSDAYDQNLRQPEYSIDSSSYLLKHLAYKDLNNDGWIDANQQNLSLSINLLINADNEQRKSFALLFKEEAKKVGLKINIEAVEWSIYLDRLKSGDFDLFYGSIVSSPIPQDFYSRFHSASANGGKNYMNYQSEKVDSIIVGIQKAESDQLRNEYYRSFQQLLNKELPLYILFCPKETFAFQKSIKSLPISPSRPNYWAPSIKLAHE